MSSALRAALALCVPLCFGITDASASTFVGNPTNFTLAPITGIVVTGLVLPISIVEQRLCNASTGVREAPTFVNGWLEFPLRPDICEVRIELDGPVEVSGYAPVGGATIELELDVPTLVLVFAEPFDAADEDDRFLVELGMPGWTSAAGLLGGASSVTITPTHAMHDDLVDALVAGSAVFPDLNGDHHVSPADRQAGPLAESGN